MQNGAIVYITKPFDIEELKAKINAILENRDMTKETESKKIKEQINVLLNGKRDRKFLSFEKKCKQYKISSREKAVLKYLLAGLGVKEVAEKLFVSIHTVRNHIRHIYEKCRIQNRVEMMNLFIE